MNDFLHNLRLQSIFSHLIHPQKPSIIMDGPGTGGFGGNMPNYSQQVQGQQEEPVDESLFQVPDLNDQQSIDPSEFTGPIDPNAQFGDDINRRMSSYYHPDNQMMQQYMAALQGMPNRADYKPSKYSRVIAALGSLSVPGPYKQKYINDVEYSKYNRSLEDWQNKTKPAAAAATIEQRENVNRRQAAYQQSVTEINQQKSDRIYETTYAKLDQRATEAERKAAEWQQKFEADQHNRDVIEQFRRAQLESIEARHAADVAIRDKNYQESIRQHNMSFEAAMARIKEMEAASVRAHPDDKSTSTSTEVRDKDGNVIGSRQTNTQQHIGEPAKPRGDIELPPSNTVQMKTPDGRTINVPPDKVAEATKRGAKKVVK